MTVSEQLDQILIKIASGEYIDLYEEQDDEIFDQAVGMGERYKLIVDTGDFLELTERGYQVIEAGGFEQWKAVNKKREDEAHQAVLDSAKATTDSVQFAKSSARAAWFAGAITVLSWVYSIWTGQQTSQLENKIQKINERVSTMDSLMKRQSQIISKAKSYSVSSEPLTRQAVPGSGTSGTGSTSLR